MILLISSLIAGFLYFIFLAPALADSPVGKTFGGLYFELYQIFAASVFLSGIFGGILNLSWFPKVAENK